MQGHIHQSAGLALVAEDEPVIRMDFARVLSDFGFRVLEVGSADTALTYLEAHPEVDFLFTDVDMPGSLDGVGLAEEVERRWPHVSVVVCSGKDSVSQTMMPGSARFLAKPFSTDAISRIMHEMRIV